MEYNRKLQEKQCLFPEKERHCRTKCDNEIWRLCNKNFCIFLLDFHIITPKLNVCIGGKYDYESNGNCAADRLLSYNRDKG